MLNRVILIGRVGQDPKVIQMDGANRFATFSVATTETYKDRTTGEKKESTEWHNCVVSGSTTDVVEKYVKKGDLITIEGKKKTRTWEKDGKKNYSVDIVVNHLILMPNNRTQQSAPNNTAFAPEGHVSDGPGDDFPADDSDLPF